MGEIDDVAVHVGPTIYISGEAMTDVKAAIRDLVVANRILANEDVVDAYAT